MFATLRQTKAKIHNRICATVLASLLTSCIISEYLMSLPKRTIAGLRFRMKGNNLCTKLPAHTHTFTYTYTYTYSYTIMTRAYVPTFMHTHVRMRICRRIHIHTHTHICTETHTHTHIRDAEGVDIAVMYAYAKVAQLDLYPSGCTLHLGHKHDEGLSVPMHSSNRHSGLCCSMPLLQRQQQQPVHHPTLLKALIGAHVQYFQALRPALLHASSLCQGCVAEVTGSQGQTHKVLKGLIGANAQYDQTLGPVLLQASKLELSL